MSTVKPKTDAEIDAMRVAGRLAAEVLEMIKSRVEVGMATGEIDRICHDYICLLYTSPSPRDNR